MMRYLLRSCPWAAAGDVEGVHPDCRAGQDPGPSSSPQTRTQPSPTAPCLVHALSRLDLTSTLQKVELRLVFRIKH